MSEKDKKLTYEQAALELENVVNLLERRLALRESIKMFEKASAWSGSATKN